MSTQPTAIAQLPRRLRKAGKQVTNLEKKPYRRFQSQYLLTKRKIDQCQSHKPPL
jgi:hypothetical protein